MIKAYSALISVIIMGAVMLIVALSLVNLGGDSSRLSHTVSGRYFARNLAKACAEKGVTFIRNKEKSDTVQTYKARILIEPTYDTMLSSVNPTYNYGVSNNLGLYANSLLLYKFNLASNIPAGATILSATLKLYSSADQTNAGTIYAYKIMPANAGWVEGTHGGAAAVSVEPNWQYKDYINMTSWTGGQGLASSGIAYYAVAESSLTMPISTSTIYNFTISSSTANSWMTEANNAGVMLKTSSAYWSWFASKEATASNQHPILDIEYSVAQYTSSGGGLSQDYGYCFYNAQNTTGETWRVNATGLSNDDWSFVQVYLIKSTTTVGAIGISSWQEVASF